MTVVEIVERLQIPLNLSDEFELGKAVRETFRISNYVNKGKRVRRVSLFLQVLGLPRVRDIMNYLGMYDGTYAHS